MNATQGIPASIKQGYGNTKDTDTFERFCMRPIEAFGELVESTFGPLSTSKLILNELETPHLCSGATSILEYLNVQNPICRVIERCLHSIKEHSSTTEGSTYFVLFVTELFKSSFKLIKEGIHRNKILFFLKKFLRHALSTAESSAISLTEQNKLNILRQCYFNSIDTKLSYRSSFFKSLLFPSTPTETTSKFQASLLANQIDPDHFTILRRPGRPTTDTFLIKGLAIEQTPVNLLKDSKPQSFKCAFYTCNLDLTQTDAKSVILLETAEDLLNYSKSEESVFSQKVAQIKESGVQMLFTTGSVSPEVMELLTLNNMNAISLNSKFDLRKIAKIAKGEINTLFEKPKNVGNLEISQICTDSLNVHERNERAFITVLDSENSHYYSLIGFSPVDYQSEKIEKSIINAIGSMSSIIKSGKFICGGGSLESKIVEETKNLEIEFEGNKEKMYKEIVEASENMINKILKNGDNENLKMEIMEGKGNVSADVYRNVAGKNAEEVLVVEAYEPKVKIFEMAEEVLDTALCVDNIYFAKLSGGPDFMNGRPGHHDEDANLNF